MKVETRTRRDSIQHQADHSPHTFQSTRPRMATRQITQRGIVQLGTLEVTYELHRVPRRRHIHLMVDEDRGLQIRAPWRTRPDEAERAVLEHEQWVVGAIDRARRRRMERPVFAHGSALTLLEDQVIVKVRAECAQMSLLPAVHRGERTNQRIVLAGRSDGRGTDVGLRTEDGRAVRQGRSLVLEPVRLSGNTVRALAKAWCRREAQARLPERLRRLGHEMSLHPKRVQIRAQRSCWGSCSSRGTVSLNWRLLLLPAQLADYVLVHELCHLRHLNHSREFWSLVEQAIPEYRRRRRELAEHQHRLPL